MISKTANQYCILRPRRVIVLTVLLVIALFISACDLFNTNKTQTSDVNNIPLDKVEVIDATNLMRQISICLRDVEEIDSIYYSISPEQLGGISLAVFRQYIEVITKMGSNRGELESFQILSGSERSEIIQRLASQAPEHMALIEMSVPVVLNYSYDVDQVPVMIYFQESDQGIPYLSGEWVNYCLGLYNYSVHYFSAVTTNNHNALYSLISESFLDKPYTLSEDTVLLKVRQISRYYLLHVKSEFDQYIIKSLNISEIVFEQPDVLSQDMDESQTRQVRFFYNQRGTISVEDQIENAIFSRDLYLYFQDRRTVRIGDVAIQSFFDSLFGRPTMTTIGQVIGYVLDESEEPQAQRHIIVDYGSIIFTIIGHINVNDEWEGSIVKISIGSQADEASLGRMIYPGMSRDDFMAVYPFADQTDYRLYAQTDDQKLVLDILFSGDVADTVSEIHLEWSNIDIEHYLE